MVRKIQVKLILLLRSTGMSQRAICKFRHMSRSSVSEVFRIAEEKQLTYADVESLPNSEVYSIFFPNKFQEETTYTAVDYAYVHSELKRPGVTLKRLWKEYKQRCTDTGTLSFSYSKFCDDYSTYTASQNLTNRITHKPGYAIEVDCKYRMHHANCTDKTCHLNGKNRPHSRMTIPSLLDVSRRSFSTAIAARSAGFSLW